MKETPLVIYDILYLQIAAINEKHTAMAKSLIDLGADITKRNNSDMTPLMLSCKNGMTELAEYLLKNDATINETNILGETPLKISQLYGHEDLVLLLMNKYKANLRPNIKK